MLRASLERRMQHTTTEHCRKKHACGADRTAAIGRSLDGRHGDRRMQSAAGRRSLQISVVKHVRDIGRTATVVHR
jgi:hypothetical protein